MLDERKFPKFLKTKRIKNKIKVVEMANKLGISLSYYSDIENGRRLPPNNPNKKDDFYINLSSILALEEEEEQIMYDYADHDLYNNGIIPPDIQKYISNNENARILFRRVKQENLSQDQLKILEKKINEIKEIN